MDYVAEARRHTSLALHFIQTDAEYEVISEHLQSLSDIWINALNDEQRKESASHIRQGINDLPDEKRPGADVMFFGHIQREHYYDELDELASAFDVELSDKKLGQPGVLYSYADALKTPIVDDWIVKNLFSPGSVSLVCGEGGSKKTYSMIDLVVSIAMGKQWLEFEIPAPIATLLVDEESGPRRLSRRLRETGIAHEAGEDLPLFYISLKGFDLTTTDGTDSLHQTIVEAGARFVVLDALVDFMAGGDENAVSDVQPVFVALRRIAEMTQSSIVVIHHTNRLGEYRGSSALKGAVDLMLIVKSTDDSVTFKTEKARDIEPITFYALANFGDGTFNLSPTPGFDKAAMVQPLILEWLHAEELTRSELINRAKEFGIGRNSLDDALKALCASGAIRTETIANGGKVFGFPVPGGEDRETRETGKLD